MSTRTPSNVERLDSDGRLIVRTHGVKVAWRVVPADRDRIDPGADYLFCAPDFLFPAHSDARALRVELEPRAPGTPASRGRTARASRR